MNNIDWNLIIFLFLLVDSMGAIILSFKASLWWPRYFAPLAKYFPMAKGWALLYFILVLVIGYYMGMY